MNVIKMDLLFYRNETKTSNIMIHKSRPIISATSLGFFYKI